MNENVNNELFTNRELSHLHNALTTALFYSKEHLSTWTEIAKQNPSAVACIKMTELEISAYSGLIEKIESIRGF